MTKFRATFSLLFTLFCCGLIAACVSLDMQARDPEEGSASEAPERPRRFQFLARTENSRDWLEGLESPARWIKSEFAPESVLRDGATIVLGGSLRTVSTTPSLIARTLILSSQDGGNTWREEDVAAPGTLLTDLRRSNQGASGLVFFAQGDGALAGLALERGGQWQFIPVPQDFDAQKKIGFGSYFHLGHEVAADSALIFLEGADKAAEFKFNFKARSLSFVRLLDKSQADERRKSMPDPRAAELEWARLMPNHPPFWVNRLSGEVSDLPL